MFRPIDPAHWQARGLVGFWPLDRSLRDISPNPSSDGVLVGNAVWREGGNGWQLPLNGVDQYVQIANASRLNFGAGDFSILARVSLSNSQAGRIISGWGNTAARGWLLDANEGASGTLIPGNLRSRITDDAGNTIDYTAAVGLDDGQWHWVAMTIRRNSSSGLSLYHNGVLAGSRQSTIPLTGSVSTAEPFGIGHVVSAAGNYLAGSVSQVRMYSRALSDMEISHIHGNPLAIYRRPIRPIVSFSTSPTVLAASDVAGDAGIDPAALTQTHFLAAADVQGEVAIDDVALGQTHALAASDLAAAASIDPAALAQTYLLAAGDAQGQGAIDAVALTGGAVLAAAEVQGQGAIDAVALGQTHALAAPDLAGAAAIDPAVLVQTHALAAGDVQGEATIDAVALTGGAVLAAAEVQCQGAIDAVALGQTHTLAAPNVAGTVGIDPAALAQTHLLAAGDVQGQGAIDAVPLAGPTMLQAQDVTGRAKIGPVAITVARLRVGKRLSIARVTPVRTLAKAA